MDDDVDVEGKEYRKKLKHFLAVERRLSIRDDAFLELWHIGEQWHNIRDCDFYKEKTVKEYKTLKGAANKMLTQMNKHEAFLVRMFLFDDEELLHIVRNTLEITVRNTLEMIETLEGPPKKVQSPIKKVERPIKKVKRPIKMHAPAETRNQFIVHLAE
jgi:hypothetical protein